MKLSGHYISVVVLIVLSQGVMWAQLNIVGVNTEKPISRINYLEQPLNIDKYLDNEVDMRNGVIQEIDDYNRIYTMPQGQLLYHTRDCFPPFLKKIVFSDLQLAFRVKGDSLIIGFPKGYYKLVGMLLTKEDMAPFSNLKKFYYVNKNNEILSDKEVATMIDEQAQYDFWEMERSCRRTLNWVLEHTLSINELKEEIANDRIRVSNLNVPVYLLENPQGVIYYTVNDKDWFDGKSHLVNVEFVNKIMSLFKGKRFYIAGCPYLRDFYTNHEIKVQPADRIFSSDGDFWDGLNCVKKFEQTHSYLCKDIVIDGDKILGIFEWDNNTIVQELPNSFYKSTFSLRDDKDRVIYKSTIHFLCSNNWSKWDFTMLSEDELSRLKKDCIKAQSLGSQSQAAKDALIAREQAAHKRAILDKYGAEYGDKIMKHQLALGMTPEMCKESIGWPSRTYKITTAFVETLVYYYAYMAVYFENEKLTRIEEVH